MVMGCSMTMLILPNLASGAVLRFVVRGKVPRCVFRRLSNYAGFQKQPG